MTPPPLRRSSSSHESQTHAAEGGATTHHTAAGVAGVLEVVVQQLGGAVLEGLGQRPQQHGELRRVELEQRDQDHLGRLCVWGGGGGGGGWKAHRR